MFHVLIQHAADTGRYHPAHYRYASFPGATGGPTRYKSAGHHTEGFTDEADAQTSARRLADELGIQPGLIQIRELESAGADVLLMDAYAETHR